MNVDRTGIKNFACSWRNIYIGQTGRQFNVLLREAMLPSHVAWLCVAIFRNATQTFKGRFSVSEEISKRKKPVGYKTVPEQPQYMSRLKTSNILTTVYQSTLIGIYKI